MKTALVLAITTLGILAVPTPAHAGGFRVFIGGGSCGPRYAPPVCYAPQPVYYCPPRVFTTCQPAPLYYAPAPVYYVPRPCFYQAPIVRTNFVVGGPVFGWRR